LFTAKALVATRQLSLGVVRHLMMDSALSDSLGLESAGIKRPMSKCLRSDARVLKGTN